MMKVALMMYDGPLRTGAVLHHISLLLYRGGNYRKIRAARSETTVEKSGLRLIHQSAVTIMSPQDARHLHDLLNNFGAERLGEGDVIAGANLLAAFAIAIADVQRPGSGLVTRDGRSIAVGTSLLVSGSYSASLISEKVISGLAMRQNNLTSRFCQRRTRETGKENDSPGVPQAASSDFAADWAETVMHQLAQLGAISDQQANECWGAILRISQRTDLSYLRDHPVVFATGGKVAELSGQLDRCHLGRPVVHVGLDSVAYFARFEHLCPIVMDGRMIVGPLQRISGGWFWRPIQTRSSARLSAAVCLRHDGRRACCG